MYTEYLPAERFPIEVIEKQRSLVVKDEIFRELVEKIPYPILILNSLRQIVYYNEALLQSFSDSLKNNIIGLRPGEIFKCKYSNQNAGCGTTQFCRTCGAAHAIAASLAGREDIQECKILTFEDDAYDFRVWTYPKIIGNEKFSIFTLIDISHEKRREMMERIFYHDILNTANGVIGFLQMYFSDSNEFEKNELIKTALNFMKILVDEVNSQRIISYAESGILEMNIEKFFLADVINELLELYKIQIDSKNVIILNESNAFLELTTDKTILRRVILNILKNAIEASTPGSRVKIQTIKSGTETIIKIHNEQVMPEEVQLQIFKRSFSTKGKGRGLGTYSIKLLTERFLKGKVSFISKDGFGTEFTISIPDYELQK